MYKKKNIKFFRENAKFLIKFAGTAHTCEVAYSCEVECVLRGRKGFKMRGRKGFKMRGRKGFCGVACVCEVVCIQMRGRKFITNLRTVFQKIQIFEFKCYQNLDFSL